MPIAKHNNGNALCHQYSSITSITVNRFQVQRLLCHTFGCTLYSDYYVRTWVRARTYGDSPFLAVAIIHSHLRCYGCDWKYFSFFFFSSLRSFSSHFCECNFVTFASAEQHIDSDQSIIYYKYFSYKFFLLFFFIPPASHISHVYMCLFDCGGLNFGLRM